MAPSPDGESAPVPKGRKGKGSAKASKKAAAGAGAGGAGGEGGEGGEEDDSVCQVPGCGIALATLKVYNQRCRVCQEHLLSGSVDFEGVDKRFCQQCARFHDVEEFDGAKRSCRVRLERHKLQRRKRKCQAAEAAQSAQTAQKKKTSAPAGEKAPAQRMKPDPIWGGLLAEQEQPSRLRGFGTGMEELEEEGESMCPPGNPLFGERLRATNAPSDKARLNARKAEGAFGDFPGGWDDFPPSRQQGQQNRTPELPKPKDPSFLDAVLMKLHEDLPPSSEDSHLEAWHGGPQAQFGGLEDSLWGDMGSLRSASADWTAGGHPVESVANLGYRNVQECIDGLPFDEAPNLGLGADMYAAAQAQTQPDIYGGGGGSSRGPPSRRPSGSYLRLGLDGFVGLPGEDKHLADIMRSLHGDAGGDAPSGLDAALERFAHGGGVPAGFRGLGGAGGFAPSRSPPPPQGFFPRYH